MSRGRLNKIDIESKVYKLKTRLYRNEMMNDKSATYKDGAHHAFNLILDLLDEYHS